MDNHVKTVNAVLTSRPFEACLRTGIGGRTVHVLEQWALPDANGGTSR
jgi:hypothetical protein